MAVKTKTVVVEAVNERGVKYDNAWHNYSKFAANGAIDRNVVAGSVVEVEEDGSGWVRALRVVVPASPSPVTETPQASPAVGSRTLDAAQYARSRAVEIASSVAMLYGQSPDEYLQIIGQVASWITAYILNGATDA